jgi:dynactin 1
MGDSSGFEIGQTVELQDGRIAIVRFVGDTHFAPGDWIGVVLGDDSGKNDGSVLGHRYFECDPGHGMFVKPPAIATVLAQPTPKPIKRASGGPAGASVKSRPSSGVLAGLRRQSVDPTASKRQSFNAGSPTPGARATATKLLQVNVYPTFLNTQLIL